MIHIISQSNAKNASKLIEILREANQNVPAELEAMGNKWGESGRGGYNGMFIIVIIQKSEK